MALPEDRQSDKTEVLEQPCKENGFVWKIAAKIEGFDGIGKHPTKRSAVMLAEKDARDNKRRALSPPPPTQEQKTPALAIREKDPAPLGIHKLIHALGKERGQRAEDWVFGAFEPKPQDLPPWFIGLRRPTREQDRFEQIDAIVLTEDAGELYIQIKSSFGGFVCYSKRNPNPKIPCIVITADFDDRQIRQKIIAVATHMRQHKLKQKQKT